MWPISIFKKKPVAWLLIIFLALSIFCFVSLQSNMNRQTSVEVNNIKSRKDFGHESTMRLQKNVEDNNAKSQKELSNESTTIRQKNAEDNNNTKSWKGFGPESSTRLQKNAEDNNNTKSWKGFGPERGLYNFTLVTAMLDIGRGNWTKQSRPYNTYLSYMEGLLQLDVNMVVFVEPKGKPFIEWMRRGRENRTRITVTTLKDLPYYRYKDRMAEIMNSSEYKKDNELVAQQLCESYVPEYDILQLSKLYFINRTITENPFQTNFFIWLDGGYGHGQDIYPKNRLWFPKNLFEFADRATFLERTPGVKNLEEKQKILHKLSVNAMPGGFFAGGSKILSALYALQVRLVEEWMSSGIVDDDQTAYMLLYYKNPSMFRLVPADWFDVFKLFNSETS
uniref:Uncharacterized protein n=1 Tax=Biomphalaria glabrata TaxID=6526 RepID=A0A2C9KZX9_BIOGL